MRFSWLFFYIYKVLSATFTLKDMVWFYKTKTNQKKNHTIVIHINKCCWELMLYCKQTSVDYILSWLSNEQNDAPRSVEEGSGGCTRHSRVQWVERR